jgi:HAD superfamily hydrolase (TIGR01450 family)
MSLKEKKFFLLDMDGTIYLDNDLFDGTLDFLSAVKSSGARYLFVTNNSSKSTDAYVKKLERIGISATEEDFLTSTDATCLYLKRYEGKKFYVSGTKSFEAQLKNEGIITTTEIEDDIFGIVMGNDTELTFKKLDDVCRLLTEREMVYIATNPDWVCPTSYGYVPDCGAVAEMIKRATGKSPIFIGKPKPEMLLLAMEKFGYTKDETLMVGDRVYTDIASGYNAGVDTVLVLSGEGTVKDAESSDTKPTYILENIRELYNKVYK